MKTLFIFAALAALTLQAQQTPASTKAEQRNMTDNAVTAPAIQEPNYERSAPTALTEHQAFLVRDAQFANQQFSDYMTKVIQPQLDKTPDYVRLRDAAKASSEAVQKLEAELTKKCPNCKIDYASLTIKPAAKEPTPEK